MKRNETPILLTVPLGIERRPRLRPTRLRRALLLALAALGVALIAAELWLPAKAALAQHFLAEARQAACVGVPARD